MVALIMSAWNKEQTLQFPDYLRETPPLWDVKHVDHRNRVVIHDSYQKIVDLLRPDTPDISIDAIKKKFLTITSQVNAEWYKLRESTRSGAGAEDVYVPKLWFFEEAKFMKTASNDLRASLSNVPPNSDHSQVLNSY